MLCRTVRYVNRAERGKSKSLTKADDMVYTGFSQLIHFFSAPIAPNYLIGDDALGVSMESFGEEVPKASSIYNLLRIFLFLAFGRRFLFRELSGFLVLQALIVGSAERRV